MIDNKTPVIKTPKTNIKRMEFCSNFFPLFQRNSESKPNGKEIKTLV